MARVSVVFAVFFVLFFFFKRIQVRKKNFFEGVKVREDWLV